MSEKSGVKPCKVNPLVLPWVETTDSDELIEAISKCGHFEVDVGDRKRTYRIRIFDTNEVCRLCGERGFKAMGEIISRGLFIQQNAVNQPCSEAE